MIDIRRLRYDGKFNYQEGLYFYFSNRGHVISFLIDTIGDNRRKTRVTMQPDINHKLPHVHIDKHGVSFAIDNGEILAGKCDKKIERKVREWIQIHRDDLLQLWDIAKSGKEYRPQVERIKRNKSFEDFGFKGDKPNHQTDVDGVRIWYNCEIIIKEETNGIKHIISEGDMYVGLPSSYKEGSCVFESKGGQVYKGKI